MNAEDAENTKTEGTEKAENTDNTETTEGGDTENTGDAEAENTESSDWGSIEEKRGEIPPLRPAPCFARDASLT